MAEGIQFSRNVRAKASKIENNAFGITKKVARVALRHLVLGTPVDTGKHRSNWRVSIGAPTRAVIPAYAPGEKLGIHETANASAAIENGLAKINELKKTSRGVTSALYICNNAPAIGKLRTGTSTQQRSDWVADAFAEASAAIRGAKLLEGTVSEDDDN